MSTITHSHAPSEAPPARVTRIAPGHDPRTVAYLLDAGLRPGNCAGCGGPAHPAIVVVVADVDGTSTRTPTCRDHLALRLRRIAAAGGRNVEVRGPAEQQAPAS